jgi:hypothetical protein
MFVVALLVLMCCVVAKAYCATVQTFRMSGTFNMNFKSKDGSNLEGILGHDNGWNMFLVHPWYFKTQELENALVADLFNFQFTGEDADLLNSEIVPYFEQAMFIAKNHGANMEMEFVVRDSNWEDQKVLFKVFRFGVDLFELDTDGYPIIRPFPSPVDADLVVLFDKRGDITYEFAAINQGTFSFIPIPSAVWLLGSGLIGLVGFRRKFRKP